MPPNNNGQQSPNGPVMDVQRTPQPTAAPNQPPVASQPVSNGIPAQMLPQPNQKKSHVLAIVVAILMAVLIICASIALFVIAKNKPEPVAPAATSQVPAEEGVVTGETIDTVITTIEQNLNGLNDQQDFTPNDISDEVLGLQAD